MKLLKIQNKDKFAIVDDEDYERLAKYKWVAYKGDCIARSTVFLYKRKFFSLASEIMNNHEQMFDHKDRDTFNNLKLNLRPCSHSQNMCNRSKRENTISKFRGVEKRKNKWKARISFNNKNYYLGLHFTQEEAALAYNIKAKELHGEFAQLNIL